MEYQTGNERQVTATEPGSARSQYQRVADQLRLDIVEGLWRPDARLKVRDLAAHYGVSPAPVRESLQQLQGEGLVVMEPNCGARVRPLDEQLIVNVFDVREAMESFLTAKFVDNASPYQIGVLEGVQAEHDAAVEQTDYLAAFRLNARFHHLINSAARNSEALAVIDRHLNLTRALRMECGFTEARMQAVCREHHELLAAFLQGDAQVAGHIAALHVRSSRDDLLDRLRLPTEAS
jgi:DNA-binding GntR family transcriptional regulator